LAAFVAFLGADLVGLAFAGRAEVADERFAEVCDGRLAEVCVDPSEVEASADRWFSRCTTSAVPPTASRTGHSTSPAAPTAAKVSAAAADE
jgi:hypothetical protein